MAITDTRPETTTSPQAQTPAPQRSRGRGLGRDRPNVLGGAGAWLWLLVIILPIYYVVITTFKDQAGFFSANPLLPTLEPTLNNYALVLNSGFLLYLFNSIVVTVGAVLPALLLSFMAAYAVVRGSGRFIAFTSAVFLMGLAISLQATIVPIYLIITRLGLYDSLLAIILPSAAFALPISVLILSNFMRDIPNELFESMRLDGASNWSILWNLVLPMTKPAIVTVGIYNALQVWNGFLFPLILTQSPDKRVLPLSLWAFQSEFAVNVPAILASVVLSTLPLLVLYIFGRRQLLSGLTAGFGK